MLHPQESRNRDVIGAPLKVVDVMTTKLITLSPDQSFGTAVEMLTQHSFRHFLVLHPDRTLAGVLSDRDILWAMASAPDWQKTPVMNNMTQHATTVTADTPLSTAAEVMMSRRINCLPVVDSNAYVVGIVTSTDLLKSYQQVQRSMEKIYNCFF